MFREAFDLYAHGKEDQALSRYIYLAALGFEIANFNAGFILEKSKNPKHLKRAAFFYSRSAKMDNSEARKKLGDIFYKLGDPISAVAHYVLASKVANPDPEALFNLGYAYENGIGLKKDLWSAFDMYSASLAHGKSGKIAATLAITKLRVKMFINTLMNINTGKRRPNFKAKSKHETDKLLNMIGTLIITSLIYFYVNYFYPRQQRRAEDSRNRVDEPDSPDNQIANAVMGVSDHSDSSSEADFTFFQFQQNAGTNDHEDSEIDEVD